MISSFFKNKFLASKNNNNISSIISYSNNMFNNSYGDYLESSEEGYKKNVIVYRCIHILSRAISSVDWFIKGINHENGEYYRILDSKFLNLLKNPNPRQSYESFIEMCASYLLLNGNCYVSAIRDSLGNIKEIHALRPDRIRVIPGERSIPKGYEYIVGSHKEFFKIDENTGSSDILHIKLFNPTDDWYGLSPIKVAIKSIRQHNAITEQNISFLRNGGRPSGALIYKSNLDSIRRESLRNDLKRAYEGGKNAGKILLLEGDFEWKEMGLSPKDLDFTSGKSLSSKEIALAFGIPPILIGEMSSATFSNYKEARYNFWEETVIPLLNMFVGEFSRWFSYLFDENISFEYDRESISVFQNFKRSSINKQIN